MLQVVQRALSRGGHVCIKAFQHLASVIRKRLLSLSYMCGL